MRHPFRCVPSFSRRLSAAVALFLAWPSYPAVAEPPPGYYNRVDLMTALTLRETLHEAIDDHARVPYTANAPDTWDLLEAADQDPANTDRVLDIYKNASYPKVGGGNTNYNREHSWPKSYGFPKDGPGNYPYTDCHHLFLVDRAYNSSRHNKIYQSCSVGCAERPTTATATGHSATPRAHSRSSNWTRTRVWETWIGRRGDVARALFYMDVRYEGGMHGVTSHHEPDLVLTNDISEVVASKRNESRAYMGRLSDLLQWHRDDPVDSLERQHHEAVYRAQGNRNPFIDNPEWVFCIFENVCPQTSPLRGDAAQDAVSSQP